ncbi:MAG: hypothetical protein IJN82_04985 [Clostridia bacterium]|nr:hypothetical protein [Clostridia bacterium]
MRNWLSGCVAAVLLTAAAALFWYFSDYRAFRQVEELCEVVQFGHDGEPAKVEEKLEPLKLAAYEGQYRDAASTYYRDACPNEKADLIYNAVLYAFDHGYDYICFPAAVCDDDLLFEAARYAVFDHPLLEENMAMDIVEVKYTYRDFVRYFYELKLPTNDGAHKAKKLYALNHARDIVEEQRGNSEEETARNLYDWLVRNVQYIEELNYNENDPHYIYDALVNGASNCDGMSNAYALLANLAGIECFNVSNVPDEDGVGHTWNILRLNGEYYQVDVTAESGYYEVVGENLFLSFARSAEALANGAYEEGCASLAPACSDKSRDGIGVDLFVSDRKPSKEERQQLDAAIERLERGEKKIVIRCEALSETDWDYNLSVLADWFASCRVEIRVVSAGKCCCVIYRN